MLMNASGCLDALTAPDVASSLDAALQLFAQERGLQMIYPYALVADRHTGGAHGDLTVAEALNQLLANSGLQYSYLDEKTITLSIAPKTLKQADSSNERLNSSGIREPRVATGTPGTAGPTRT